MHPDRFKSVLDQWQSNQQARSDRTTTSVAINTGDMIRLKALCETFELDIDEVTATLLQLALQEIEEKMPYIPGTKVIREEEGEPVYEDCGPMPVYLKAQKRVQQDKH